MATVIDIDRMTFDERLELYDQLVNSLTPDRRFDFSPAWHKDVLGVRERLEQEGKVKYVALDDLLGQLRTEGLCK